MRSFGVASLIVLLLTLLTSSAPSQSLDMSDAPLSLEDAPGEFGATQIAPEPSFSAPFWAAAGLGLVGWGIGALAGRAIQGDCSPEYCELEGIFYGGAAGGGLGLAVGAHLGNRRRGSFLVDLAVSGAVWGAGFVAMRTFADNSVDEGVVLTAVTLPLTQLLATVAVERAVGRSRARRSTQP